MERYLLTVPDERGNDNLLHVSDLTKNIWCPRMLYYRMNGVRPEQEARFFQLQNILDHGSTAHLKYQARWRDMGVLWGRWKCMSCHKSWLGEVPIEGCIRCGVPLTCVEYMEVPLAAPELLLVGNSDAEVRDPDGNVLVEIKTVAEGTFRVDVPKLLGEYTGTIINEQGKPEKRVDIVQLWKDLRRPVPSHMRQGETYVELRKRMKDEPPIDGIVYWYESKHSQGLKEFFLEPNPSVAKQVLDRAADVTFAIKRKIPPRCPEGRDGCKLCQSYEEEVRKNGGVTAPTEAPRKRGVLLSGGKPV